MMAFTKEWHTDDGSHLRWEAYCIELPEIVGAGPTQEDAVDDLFEQVMYQLHRTTKH